MSTSTPSALDGSVAANALRADTIRQYGRAGTSLCLKGFLARRAFRPIVTLRLCQMAAAHPVRSLLLPLARVMHRWACNQAGMDLPAMSNIGAGLSIAHGWGLVVNGEARIGANVTLFHGVTIGRRDRIDAAGRQTSFPVIDDEVWIGPHAVVVGGVHIGRGARIGAGAVVTSDVPAFGIVQGNPGQLVRIGDRSDVVNPA